MATSTHPSWQACVAMCLETAFGMFPEGKGGPKAVPKTEKAAPLTNALLVNASKAVGKFWEARGYDPKKPEVTKAKLGYALDTYDATAYVVLSKLLLAGQAQSSRPSAALKVLLL